MTEQISSAHTTQEFQPEKPLLTLNNHDFLYHTFLRETGGDLLQPDQITKVILRDTLKNIGDENAHTFVALHTQYVLHGMDASTEASDYKNNLLERMKWATQTPELPDVIKDMVNNACSQVKDSDWSNKVTFMNDRKNWRDFNATFEEKIEETPELKDAKDFTLPKQVEAQLSDRWDEYMENHFSVTLS